MRVLMLGPSEPAQILQASPPPHGWPKGDGGQPVNDLARELVRAGVEVTLVSLTSSLDRVWTHSEGRLNIVQIPMRPYPQRRLADLYAVERRRLKRAIADQDFDVMHAHWTYAYAHAALGRDLNALIGLHDSPRRLLALAPSPGLLALSLQTAWTARRGRNFVAASPYVAETWMVDFRGKEPLAVLPNMTPELDVARASSENKPSVLSLGHPHPNKNLKSLLAAWPAILARVPGAELSIAGAGTEVGGAFDQATGASRLGIRMLGQVARPRLAELLGGTRVMVHPSLSEACPMSIIEAVSFGIPCVVGVQAGPMEWMIGKGGAVVDVTDHEKVADATVRLLNDEFAWNEAHIGAVEASRKFAPSVVTPQWLRLYERLARMRSR